MRNNINKKRMSEKKENRGSVIVEMTFILPICVIMVYLYIMYLLFGVGLSKNLFVQAEKVYTYSEEGSKEIKGNTDKVEVTTDNPLFHATIVLRKNAANPVRSIRRWQLAIRKVS